MKYNNLPEKYRRERIREMFQILDAGKALAVNGLYLEEIKFLKSMYGRELRKQDGILYRAMEEEALF